MECVLYFFFLTSSLAKAAGHSIEDAMAVWNLYYVGLFPPVIGGFLADWGIAGLLC
jgi:hypothetical protein